MIRHYGRLAARRRHRRSPRSRPARREPQLQPRDGRAARVARSRATGSCICASTTRGATARSTDQRRATSRTSCPCGRCRRARPKAISRRRSSTTASCSSRRRSTKCIAIDAKTGDLLWRYRHQMPADIRMGHPTNRGVALYGDKVYTATSDARVVALDAKTGAVVWNKAVENYNNGYYMTIAPLAARGRIMVGVSGGERGIRGFVVALDAQDRRAGLEDLHGSRARRARQRHLARRLVAHGRRAGLGHGQLRSRSSGSRTGAPATRARGPATRAPATTSTRTPSSRSTSRRAR